MVRAFWWRILVDEAADISDTELLSFGVLYIRCDKGNENPIICEGNLQELAAEMIIYLLENCNFHLLIKDMTAVYFIFVANIGKFD